MQDFSDLTELGRNHGRITCLIGFLGPPHCVSGTSPIAGMHHHELGALALGQEEATSCLKEKVPHCHGALDLVGFAWKNVSSD